MEEKVSNLLDSINNLLFSEHHFTKVKISATALIKMVMHTKSGGDLEVMGMMQGKVMGDTFYVMDAISLPVEGTETRVNAAADASWAAVSPNTV